MIQRLFKCRHCERYFSVYVTKESNQLIENFLRNGDFDKIKSLPDVHHIVNNLCKECCLHPTNDNDSAFIPPTQEELENAETIITL